MKKKDIGRATEIFQSNIDEILDFISRIKQYKELTKKDDTWCHDIAIIRVYRAEAAAQKWTEEWTAKQKGGGGGNYYYTKIDYLGPEYIGLAFQRYHQNQIDADQLADYLDTKPKNLTYLEEYVLQRAS